MKRWLWMLLAAAMLLGLAACTATVAPGDSGAGEAPAAADDEQATDDEQAADGLEITVNSEETEPGPTAAEAAPLDLEAPNTVEDQVAYTIVNAYETTNVVPPRVTGVHTYYEAPAGSTYLVMVTDVQNLGGQSARADTLLSASLEAAGSQYPGFSIVEEDGGETFGYANITDVGALQSVRLYFLFEVPEGTDTTDLTVTFTAGDDVRAGSFALSTFESRVGELAVGQEITDGETLSLTVEDIYFSTTLYPPMPSGYYHYYSADSGNTFLILKVSATNLGGTNLRYSGVAGVTCVYDGKYQYSASACFEEDGGASLNSYPDLYDIAPLGSGTLYYLMEVPAQVEEGPVEITLYTMGQYYRTELAETLPAAPAA